MGGEDELGDGDGGGDYFELGDVFEEESGGLVSGIVILHFI